MKSAIFLILILVFAACTVTPEPVESEINTDTIAGYWSGIVEGEFDTGQELPPSNVGILIIAGCTIGNVCGKFSENHECPGDIVLMKVDGNQYSFFAKMGASAKRPCGAGSMRMIDLELRSDGTIYYVNDNGASQTGVLQKYK